MQTESQQHFSSATLKVFVLAMWEDETKKILFIEIYNFCLMHEWQAMRRIITLVEKMRKLIGCAKTLIQKEISDFPASDSKLQN